MKFIATPTARHRHDLSFGQYKKKDGRGANSVIAHPLI
jgi:hypothetical protein